MKIKQQKMIDQFLTETFGKEKGEALFDRQSETLDALIAGVEETSDSRKKTLIQTILPRIALYKVLLNEGSPVEDAYGYMRKYMLEKVAAQKHASMLKMEKVPGFYALYSKIFLKIMRKTDLQESEQRRDKSSFVVTIRKCLWHTACVEHGCPELCRLFCDVDNVTYGGLTKIGFSRAQTLGYGGDCCDFHFFKK